MSQPPRAVPLEANRLFDLTGRVVLITGAAGLLGRAFSMAVARAGASTVLVDVEEAAVGALSQQICRESGRESMPLHADISDAAQVQSMVESTMRRFGQLDVLVNNAQYKSRHFFAAFEQFPQEDWDAVMGVNVTALYLCCQAAGRQMIASGRGGSIVNLSSTYAMVAPNQELYRGTRMGCPAVYAASKGAVWSLTRYLAAYWADKKIRVNSIQPHGIWQDHEARFTENFARLSPLGRMSDASECVGALLYLASDASSYVTGANLAVDGGWTAW